MAMPSGAPCPCAKRKKLLCPGKLVGISWRYLSSEISLSHLPRHTPRDMVLSAAETQSEIGAVRRLHQNGMVIVEVTNLNSSLGLPQVGWMCYSFWGGTVGWIISVVDHILPMGHRLPILTLKQCFSALATGKWRTLTLFFHGRTAFGQDKAPAEKKIFLCLDFYWTKTAFLNNLGALQKYR